MSIRPNFIKSYINISNINAEGIRKGAIGSIVASWCDNGGPNLREMNYPGYAYEAHLSWNPTSLGKYSIEQRFDFLNRMFFEIVLGVESSAIDKMYLQLNQIPNYISYKDT